MTIRIRPALALEFTLLRIASLTVAIRPAAAQLVPGPAEGYLIITTDALANEFQPFAQGPPRRWHCPSPATRRARAPTAPHRVVDGSWRG